MSYHLMVHSLIREADSLNFYEMATVLLLLGDYFQIRNELLEHVDDSQGMISELLSYPDGRSALRQGHVDEQLRKLIVNQLNTT